MTSAIATVTPVESSPTPATQPVLTLLDLVVELSAAGGTEEEVAFAVLDLVQSGRVRLLGQIREADLPSVCEH